MLEYKAMIEKSQGAGESYFRRLVSAGACVLRTEQFYSKPTLPPEVLIQDRVRKPGEKGKGGVNPKVASQSAV